MLALFLTTVTSIEEYKINQIVEWKTQDYFPKINRTRLEGVKDVFVYFSKHGVFIHAEVVGHKRFLTLQIKHILDDPISLKELKELNVIAPNDRLQGVARYLKEEASEVLNKRFYQK